MDTKEEDTKEEDTKEEKVCISVDVVPIFSKHNYFGWRTMRSHMSLVQFRIIISLAIVMSCDYIL